MIEALETDVLLARGGDQAAFHRLVDRCANTVTAIAFAILRNVEASEDVAQEVFLAAWSKLRSLRNPASFLPWLRQVTRNQAHLWQRAHQREIADGELLLTVEDGRPSPADRVLRDEEIRLVREVLDALPDEAREVLVLYYREECSSRQVAHLLGISEDAVRQRVSRARAMLRAEVLQRFGGTAARTAPGTAFGIAVAAALTMTAPTVSAAVAASAASTKIGGAAVVAKASLAGGVLGWLGVLMGMRLLGPAIDERERRELRRFWAVVLAVVTAGCVVVSFNARNAIHLIIAVQTLYVVVGCMYVFWLPRILKRRFAIQQGDGSAQKRVVRSLIGRATGAAIGGLVLMAIAIVATS
jgi:RNA polymerase sigma factor (sigma-70 family)